MASDGNKNNTISLSTDKNRHSLKTKLDRTNSSNLSTNSKHN